MDPRWLKERALKDHRCGGMTKYIQSDEQRRLDRLRHIRSSISVTRKHNDYIDKKYAERARKQRIERRKRERRQAEELGKPGIQVFVGASSNERYTQSGLKLKMQHDMDPKNYVYRAPKTRQDKPTKCITKKQCPEQDKNDGNNGQFET